MYKFEIVVAVIATVWFLAIIKLTYDQTKLYNTYRKKVDPAFPTSPEDIDLRNLNILTILRKRLRIIYTRHPSHPELDQLAAKVRRDVLALPVLMILIMIASVTLL